MTGKYNTPAAFKAALEQRLRSDVDERGEALGRRRQRLVFDRFLARVDAVFGEAAVLKGGLVLELRLGRARTTKDVDLRCTGAPAGMLEKLQRAGRLVLGDFLSFQVAPDRTHPEITQEGMVYQGRRFRVEARLAGKIYGYRFGVDVGFADPILGEPDIITGETLLEFAGIEPARIRLYPVETHLAEKLHAYTLPRTRPNTRVKDLPDIALLAMTRELEAKRLRQAITQCFAFRDVQAVPDELPAPPKEWAPVYARMATTDDLSWPTLSDLFATTAAFLNPVLGGRKVKRWSPNAWRWDA
ncbi:MAG: nucleotidyl transferase AbiEii/AbiGii toxin family protein [Planctomycetes bacterium]|nr:nucleotidyl transferase AbiEii/AbiGii toxin family protein [Planctomycetota bacterium]